MKTEHQKELRRQQKRRQRERNIAAGLTSKGAPRKPRRRIQGRAGRPKDRTRLFRAYGITAEQYDEMLAAQDSKCAICNQLSPHRKLAVDHCHKVGRVRKLLCNGCNTALGLMKDDPERIAALHRYATEYYIAPARRRARETIASATAT